jgi:regulatory protein
VQAKNKTRVNLYIDGDFCCGLDALTVMEYRLKRGMEIDGAALAELVMSAERNSALETASKKVARTLTTEHELKNHLFNKGYLAAAVEYAVDKLKEYGYLGDAEYVKAYYNTYSPSRGDKGLQYELIGKGVDKNLIEDFFSTAGDDAPRGAAVAEKYMHGKEYTLENKGKLSHFLYSRGFSGETSACVIAEIFARAGSDGE